MNKKNWKNFFRVHGHSAGGFTLVELIVVIAILAILAGVAIPAYSGYIKKAQSAADYQLLEAVNSAFTAACLSENIDMATLTLDTAKIPLNSNKTVAVNVVMPAEVRASFGVFFAGNENAGFASFSGLTYNADKRAFEAADAAGSFNIAYGGGYITLSGAALEELKNSTFVESMGVSGLLDKVNDVTNFASAMAGSNVMDTLLTSEAFLEHAGSAMGVDPEDPEFYDKLYAKADGLAEQMMANDPSLSYSDAYNKVLANAAVLHAAKNSTDESVMTKDEITGLLSSTGASTTIRENLNTNPSQALSQASMAYGMYTAYAYSTGSQELIEKTNDPIQILNGLDDPAFQEWIASDKGQSDMDAYLSAMEMINSSSENEDAVSSLLVNGFNDQALKDVFNDALGN